jgi:hypothetical protein
VRTQHGRVRFPRFSVGIHDNHAAYLERAGGARLRTPDSTHHAINTPRVWRWLDRREMLGSDVASPSAVADGLPIGGSWELDELDVPNNLFYEVRYGTLTAWLALDPKNG